MSATRIKGKDDYTLKFFHSLSVNEETFWRNYFYRSVEKCLKLRYLYRLELGLHFLYSLYSR